MPGRQALHKEELFQQSQIPSGGKPVQAEPSSELREVDELSREDGDQPQQSAHRFEMPDSGQVGEVALDQGIRVLTMPGASPPLAPSRKGLRKAAGDDALRQMVPHPELPGHRRLSAEKLAEERRFPPGDLALRERRQADRFHPSHQGVRDGGQEERVRRPRQQEAARSSVFVHGLLDRQQRLGNPLHLVEGNPAGRKIADEAHGIGPGHLRLRQVVKGDVFPALVDQLSDQGGLPHLPGAKEKDDRRVGERFFDVPGSVAWEHEMSLLGA